MAGLVIMQNELFPGQKEENGMTMTGKVTDLRNDKWVDSDFRITLKSDNAKDDRVLSKLVASLEKGKTKIALAWSTDGWNGEIYFECV